MLKNDIYRSEEDSHEIYADYLLKNSLKKVTHLVFFIFVSTTVTRCLYVRVGCWTSAAFLINPKTNEIRSGVVSQA